MSAVLDTVEAVLFWLFFLFPFKWRREDKSQNQNVRACGLFGKRLLLYSLIYEEVVDVDDDDGVDVDGVVANIDRTELGQKSARQIGTGHMSFLSNLWLDLKEII